MAKQTLLESIPTLINGQEIHDSMIRF